MVSTQDSESCDPSSNLGETWWQFSFCNDTVLFSSCTGMHTAVDNWSCVCWKSLTTTQLLQSQTLPDQGFSPVNSAHAFVVLFPFQFWPNGNDYENGVPRRGIEPRPRRWERRILTTRPPGTANTSVAMHGMAIVPPMLAVCNTQTLLHSVVH